MLWKSRVCLIPKPLALLLGLSCGRTCPALPARLMTYFQPAFPVLLILTVFGVVFSAEGRVG
jgi:hypothetical protein